MVSRLKQLTVAGMALSLSLTTIACQEAEGPDGQATSGAAGEAPKELKIGSLLPATGDLSALGAPMIASVPLLVDKVNTCGGVNGAPVKLVANVDDQTNEAAGTEGMKRLVSVDKVAGVVGSFASSVSSAALTVAVRNKVMLVSPGSTNPKFTDRAKAGEFKGYWTRTAPSDTYQAPALAKLAYEKGGLRKVAVLSINNDYGVGFEKEFIKAFKALGGTITNEDKPVRYDPKATTFRTEVAEAFKGKPDAVAGIMYGETGSQIMKTAFEQGLSKDIPFLLTDGMYAGDLADKVGKTSDGKYIAAGALGTIPGSTGTALKDFSKIWEDKLKKPVEAYAPHAWDAAALLVLAAEAAKLNTGEGIQSKIREIANAPGEEVSDVCQALKLLKDGKEINYQGASGNVDINAQGDVLGSYDIWTINDSGKIETIGNVTPESN
ncbi:ABC transporter substrate-binding protein [filamentous cyanobacterium LEGE 11480]|uniref:ABC transporter substrate-binding protein n=1 Tax=Romeriopsis navalis LEGE 11480 TaxID=2777977 RepID=A0A928Z6Z7_9CYAN|nr:ABC transporter substrate-binding protein [Romeriopsis navalis]MBE9033183.1 ABC transporter substrate-binding protein [Romeriopsis navalis LEGE 11480]